MDQKPITEFYSMQEITEKYGVSESTVYSTVNAKRIPKVLSRGKTIYSKKHIDRHFAAKLPDLQIPEWYTVEEIREKYGMSVSAVYSFTSEYGIPRKKAGGKTYYSKLHTDMHLRMRQPDPTIKEWYSMEEIVAKYNLTPGFVSNLIYKNPIPKIRRGNKGCYSKVDFDRLVREKQLIPNITPSRRRWPSITWRVTDFTTMSAPTAFRKSRRGTTSKSPSRSWTPSSHNRTHFNTYTIIGTKITLRRKPITNGRESLYLEFYPGIHCPETMKMIYKEYLGIYIFRNRRNSAASYFSTFRAPLKIAYRDKLIRENINDFLEKLEYEDTRREFLPLDELKRLANTPCHIPVSRRAAIFACPTGLRISDILQLESKHISQATDGGWWMRIRTEKTDTEATLPISDEALEYCGTPGTGRVFAGLERSMTQHPLFKWIRKAGIERHITFHCFRHTFATLQIALGTDIFTVSKMLTTATSRPHRFTQNWSMRKNASRQTTFH